MSLKFDTQAIRKSIAYMLIVNALPFKHIERKGKYALYLSTSFKFLLDGLYLRIVINYTWMNRLN